MKKLDLSVKLGRLKLKNPLMVASGTFGYGREMQDFLNLGKLGAVVTKTITVKPHRGNPMPRTVETAAGMLNSIGLHNEGVDDFIKNKLPFLSKCKTCVIASIGALNSPDEYLTLAEKLDKETGIDALEINISCPNLGKKCLISQDEKAVHHLVSKLRKITKLPLITKLTPNVTDITIIAKAAQEAGSDIISLINTIPALAVDIKTRKAKLAMVSGGLSGPAIKPIALKLVRDVYQTVKIPIIGMGGIMHAEDAIEFMLCGASAVALGTVNFIHPQAALEVISGIKKYLCENKIKQVSNLIGKLQTGERR